MVVQRWVQEDQELKASLGYIENLFEASLGFMRPCFKRKKKKNCKAWWCIPHNLSTQEAEAWGLGVYLSLTWTRYCSKTTNEPENWHKSHARYQHECGFQGMPFSREEPCWLPSDVLLGWTHWLPPFHPMESRETRELLFLSASVLVTADTLDNSLLQRSALCSVGCFIASLALLTRCQ